jgi:acetate kinase
VKFALFGSAPGQPEPLERRVHGEIECLDRAPHFSAHDADGAPLLDRRWPENAKPEFAELLHVLLSFIDDHAGGAGMAAVGHRVVHGGAHHTGPEHVTQELLTALEQMIPLDPLHMPENLALIRAVAAARPHLTQVACFDTAFHHSLPPVAQRFALPRAISDAGARRYGFHGLSYEYVASRLDVCAPHLAKGRVVVAHLGSGASLCAMQAGRSIATTMGLSVLDGLVMGTRCGAIDPGVLLYLARQGHSFSEIETMLYHQSGLLGVSGISDDVRVLLASDDPHAVEAIDLFTYRIAAEVAAMASALGGLDGLVFTAGIGENAAEIRAAVCERLAWLGMKLDSAANSSHASRISTPDSAIQALVIPTDEELMIARHTQAVMA